MVFMVCILILGKHDYPCDKTLISSYSEKKTKVLVQANFMIR